MAKPTVKHENYLEYKNRMGNRLRYKSLTRRHQQHGHRHPEVRANSDVMGEAAYERHQGTMKHLTGKPEQIWPHGPAPVRKDSMLSEDEFGGGRRRRTRRHRKNRSTRRR